MEKNLKRKINIKIKELFKLLNLVREYENVKRNRDDLSMICAELHYLTGIHITDDNFSYDGVLDGLINGFYRLMDR